MSEYIVSARKYRPTTFDTVVGQDALVKTLKNAIDSGKLAHAYLFCGPRGVGKTTCARIFAKTINCEHRTADGEACNECESCQSFNEQRSYNIHELDAASNNSVDNIRELIDQVKIPPQIGRYKVFIIDEVHMLSSQAFNAFLKTLEEPPKHAVFIMATTEKHKILPTILSRCQTYDFQRISIQDIVAQLARIAAKEGIKAEPQALQVIARKADGGMRDALSIFDQIASFTGGNISYQATINNLNILDYELFFRLTDAALLGNIPAALLLLDDVIRRGFDPQHFIGGWASHIRDLMVSKDPATVRLIEAGQDVAMKYQEQAAKCPPQFLYYGLQIANECDFNYRNSRNKRLSVELAICRICQLMHPITPVPQCPQPLNSVKPQQQPQSQPAQPQSQPQRQPQPRQDAVRTASPVPPTSTVAPAPRPQVAPTHQSPQTAPVQTVSSRRIVSIRGISKQPQTKPAPSNASQQQTEEKNERVEPEAVMTCWRQFASDNKAEHLLVGIINQCMPEVVSQDNLNYVVKLNSEDQKTILENNNRRILQYFSDKLGNSKISISYIVSEEAKQKSLLNPRERLDAMRTAFPEIISTLQEQFPDIELA